MILKTNLDQKDIDLYNEKFAEIENIPGFPMGLDQYICDFMLSMQNKAKIEGNLSELGTYKGKYAAKMAKYLNNNEFIFIVDVSDLTDPIKNTIIKMKTFKIFIESNSHFKYFSVYKHTASINTSKSFMYPGPIIHIISLLRLYRFSISI